MNNYNNNNNNRGRGGYHHLNRHNNNYQQQNQHQQYQQQQRQQLNQPVQERLPPPIHGTFVGGNRPPGGGFAQFDHLTQRKQYDGKALRKAVQRRTIDTQPTIMRYLQNFYHVRKKIDFPWIQREKNFVADYWATFSRDDNVVDCVTTRFAHSSINKIRCPINAVKYTPDGRRMITGSTSGEFTLWNAIMFNFETLLQAHDSAIKTMLWSHNDQWMVSSDHGGYVKYWQSNMNNVKAFQAHKEPVRGVSFSPSDAKIVTCSDDATIRVWDFLEAREEKMLAGHGWDVRCVDWHPYKSLIASGSKDNLVKLWDPKAGKELATFHGHKNTVLCLNWNKNGNWLLVGSRDQMIKIYDIRMMREMQIFKGHKNEVDSLAWHPFHESLFASGGSEGSLYFWLVGDSNPSGKLESAHDMNIWSLDWHPMGHILCSGSNDYCTRFWTRHRPEDRMTDNWIHGKPESEKNIRRMPY